jgi:hypothetical protein
MVALTAERDTSRRDVSRHADPVKANVKIFAGALVCLDGNGWLVPGATAATLRARGRAIYTVDAAGLADGAVRCEVDAGCFLFANLAADVITRADIGGNAFIVDDQTVARTNGGNTRSVAGRVVDVAPAGVWIEIR